MVYYHILHYIHIISIEKRQPKRKKKRERKGHLVVFPLFNEYEQDFLLEYLQ